MSTYSGFSSRKLEDKYNNYLNQLLNLLSQIIISHISRQKLLPFKSLYQKLIKQFDKLQSQKYSQPKYSKTIQPLTEHFINYQTYKQSMSQPSKRKQFQYKDNKRNTLLNNNFIRTRNLSIQQTRRTISFIDSSSKNNQIQKQYNQIHNSGLKSYEKGQRISKQNRYKQNSIRIQYPTNNSNNNNNNNYNNNNNKEYINNNNIKYKIPDKPPLNSNKNIKIYRSSQTSLGDKNYKSFFDHQKNINIDNQNELSMQQLMRKNPLVQRKMSAHKRRRYFKVDITQIRQEQNQGEELQVTDRNEELQDIDRKKELQVADRKEELQDIERKDTESMEERHDE